MKRLIFYFFIALFCQCKSTPQTNKLEASKGTDTTIKKVLPKLSWVELRGQFADVAGGPDGSLWAIIGNEGNRYGQLIYKWDNSILDWKQMGDGRADRIAIEANGNPIVKNYLDNIYRSDGHLKDKKATDVATGYDGSIWLTGTTIIGSGVECPPGFGYIYYKLIGQDWMQMPGVGCGRRIAVSPDGNPWVTNTSGKLSKRINNDWVGVDAPDDVQDVAIDRDGIVWIVSRRFIDEVPKRFIHCVYKLNGNTWQPYPLPIGEYVGYRDDALTVTSDGHPVVVIDRSTTGYQGIDDEPKCYILK